MLDNLTTRLARVMKTLKGEARLTESNIADALREAKGKVLLRPEPHRFAAFRVLRRAEAPAVLFEAGYMSNAADEAMLLDPAQRGRIVKALARAIEAETAIRR